MYLVAPKSKIEVGLTRDTKYVIATIDRNDFRGEGVLRFNVLHL